MGRAVVAVTLTLAAGATVDAQQTFRAGVEVVHFSIVVTDRRGAPITGLTVEDFEVVEKGRPQAITYFAGGNESDHGRPLHLGLALDTSGSMEQDIRDVRTGVVKFLNANEHAADVTLVDFDTEIRLARYGGAEYARLIERIRMQKAGGWTAFYDALGMYLNGAADQDGEKIALVYTDGGDTRSSLTLSELVDLLKTSDVTLYAIGYLENQSSSVRNQQRMQLERLAATTGGQAFFPTSLKELEKIYDSIQRQIAARYSIGYSSTDPRMDGAWRPVQIRLKRQDLKGAKIRTRAGYFAPYKSDSDR